MAYRSSLSVSVIKMPHIVTEQANYKITFDNYRPTTMKQNIVCVQT